MEVRRKQPCLICGAPRQSKYRFCRGCGFAIGATRGNLSRAGRACPHGCWKVTPDARLLVCKACGETRQVPPQRFRILPDKDVAELQRIRIQQERKQVVRPLRPY